eukprot:4266056-Alexandrium_andersonii.AAC.1
MVCFEQLQEEKYSKLLSKDVFSRLQAVITEIKPACGILNGGRLAVPGLGLIWCFEQLCLPSAVSEWSGFTSRVATSNG